MEINKRLEITRILINLAHESSLIFTKAKSAEEFRETTLAILFNKTNEIEAVFNSICKECPRVEEEESPEEPEIENPCKCCGSENDNKGIFCSDCSYEIKRQEEKYEQN